MVNQEVCNCRVLQSYNTCFVFQFDQCICFMAINKMQIQKDINLLDLTLVEVILDILTGITLTIRGVVYCKIARLCSDAYH